MPSLRPLLKPLFWAALVFAYVAAILPSDQAPGVPSDKVNHIIAFLTLTVLAALAYPRVALWRIPVLLGLFGAIIELTQAIPVLRRDGDPIDWLVDVGAILVAMLVAALLRRRFNAALTS